jgi:NADH dehydrogenase
VSSSVGSGAGLYVVTGAFGYSGKYITARLLAAGNRIRTLTNSLQRQNPFGTAVETHPYNFDRPDELAHSLQGADVLINTYWVRFDHKDFSHTQAVRNTLCLFDAARRAGIRRVVHISITNPSAESKLPYFRGKAELEAALRVSGLSYAILRPTVLFGEEDILINNIAWMLRRFPVFGVFGDGSYRVQPIIVDDLAHLAVEASGRSENMVRDAIGPETFTYRELVSVIGVAIGRRRPIVSIPPWLGVAVGRLVGAFVGDVVVTPEEVAGLMRNLLVTARRRLPAPRRCLSGSWTTGTPLAEGTRVNLLAGATGRRPTSNYARARRAGVPSNNAMKLRRGGLELGRK